ncbi:MAG TPA: ABC transporter substrate-binding protein [Chloroflexota bacterium]|nr:ABC transporter substrate-binding protein [Chloroflexota bacterium]
MPRHVNRGVCLLALAVLIAAGCAPGSSAGPAAPPTSSAVSPTAGAAPSAAAAAPAATSTAPPAATHLRVASQNIAGDVMIYWAAERGYYQQEGLDVEIVPILDASQMTPALATEQVDVAGIGGTAPMWNAVARGVPLKLVLDKGTFRPGADFGALVVRKDLYDAGRARRLDDFKGLTLGLIPPGKASGNGAIMAHALRGVGLTLDDLNVQSMPFPDMVPALANGALDAAVLGEPFLLRAERGGAAVKLAGNSELYPDYTVSALCFTPTLYNNQPAARAYARAYVRAVREYLTALAAGPGDATRAQVDEVMARYTGIDQAVVRDMVPVGFSPNALPNRDSLLYTYQFFRELGLVSEPIPDPALTALWGTDLMDNVLAELGRLPEG